jgi:hypothetical protein
MASVKNLMARGGIEPPIRRFSVARSYLQQLERSCAFTVPGQGAGFLDQAGLPE